MSLKPSALLKPRETIENYEADFVTVLHSMDVQKIFDRVIKLDVQKRILINAIYSPKPVNLIFVGPAGNGKTLLLECIRDAFPLITNWSDSHTSSGIGVMESILAAGKMLRFVLVDEIEKFTRRDRQVFLSLIERGSVSRKLAERNIEITGFKVWFMATCNDIDKIRRQQPELINRCSIINVPALSYEDYIFVASKRLIREEGTNSEEIAKYIASRVYHDFGTTDMRLAVRLANFAQGVVKRTKGNEVTKDIIDSVAMDFKLTVVKV